jgi:hypothetical protein
MLKSINTLVCIPLQQQQKGLQIEHCLFNKRLPKKNIQLLCLDSMEIGSQF